MILFETIYNRAIKLFDDPDIEKAYYLDKAKWAKLMYRHLISGVNLFTNPTVIAWKLVEQTEPKGTLETFTSGADPTAATYKVVTLSTTPKKNSVYSYKINGVPDTEAVYDSNTNTVTFSKDITTGTTSSVEWYFPGSFNANFETAATSNVSAALIESKVVDILARALVVSWAEKEKNFLLDIKNILTDTDFKMYSPANSIKSKVEWVAGLQSELDTIQNKLGWDLISVKHHGGKFYG